MIKDNCKISPSTFNNNAEFIKTEQKIQKNFLNFLNNMPYLQKGSIFGNSSNTLKIYLQKNNVYKEHYTRITASATMKRSIQITPSEPKRRPEENYAISTTKRKKT